MSHSMFPDKPENHLYNNLRSKDIAYMMHKEIIRTSQVGSVQPHVIHVTTLLV